MPVIVNTSPAERARVENAITGLVSRLVQITDAGLRDCMRRRSQGRDRIVNADDECGENVLGYSQWRMIGPFVIWKSRDIHVCLRNHGALAQVELENTLMHEWAHSCCWRHGDSKGVPE